MDRWLVISLALILAASHGLVKAQSEADQCEPGKAKSFLVGFRGHTGSTAIMSTLMQHSELEVILPLEPVQTAKTPTEASEMTKRYFDVAVAADQTPGFKLRPMNVFGAELDWGTLASDYKVRFVGLSRRNLFKISIGLYSIRARFDNTAVMGLRSTVGGTDSHCQSNPESCYFEVKDIRFFASLMHQNKVGAELIDQMMTTIPWACRLNVTYEEYLTDERATLKRIYDFLGVGEEYPPSKFDKAIPDNPCEVLTNYQEVCSKLWGCEEFQQHLEDPKYNCYCEDKTVEVDSDLCNFTALKKDSVCKERAPDGTMRYISCPS